MRQNLQTLSTELSDMNDKFKYSDEKLILNESSSIKFLNLDALWYFLFSYFHSPNRDKTDFSGDIIALPEVKEW